MTQICLFAVHLANPKSITISGSPTRCSLQSGRLPVHVNSVNVDVAVHNPADPVSGFQGIPTNMTGIAEVLKRAGYRTHFVGKVRHL